MLVQQLVNIADGFVVQTVVESLPHFICEHWALQYLLVSNPRYLTAERLIFSHNQSIAK
jgi:hypothetical protein